MKPFLLLKFFPNENYIKNFLEKGEIHFSPFSEFNNSNEKQNHQMDLFEGHDYVYKSEFSKLIFAGIKLKPTENSYTTIKLSDGHPYTHICSFSTVYDHSVVINNKELLFDPMLYEFGDRFVFLHFNNMKKFIKKILNQCKIMNIGCKCGFVHYIDNNKQDGVYGPFEKRENYSYQFEYRIALTKSPGKSNNMYVGNLKNIFHGPVQRNYCDITVKNGSVNL